MPRANCTPRLPITCVRRKLQWQLHDEIHPTGVWQVLKWNDTYQDWVLETRLPALPRDRQLAKAAALSIVLQDSSH